LHKTTQIKLDKLFYEQENEKILNNISYEFAPGCTTGILSHVEDKSAVLLKIIGGITQPTSGKVSINGIDLFNSNRETLRPVRKAMAFVFERKGILSNISIRENLLLPLNYHYPDEPLSEKQKKIDALFEYFEIPKKVLSERPARLHRQTLKMILLIRAFVMEPDIILYDNPLVDLELTYAKSVCEYIRQLKIRKNVTQIFFSTSKMLFEDADNMLVFSDGLLVETGSLNTIIKSENPLTRKLIQDYFEAGTNETQI
jgi:ABC-type transporter Mla maintaining outer membrane lipid asymmetry ATPase subunit MlaF